MSAHDLKYFEGQIARFIEHVNAAFDEDICKKFSTIIDNPLKLRGHIVLSTTRMASEQEFDGLIRRIKTTCKLTDNIEKVIDLMKEIRKQNMLYEESNLVSLASANLIFANYSVTNEV